MLTLATKFAPVQKEFEVANAAGFRAAEFWLDANYLLQGEQIFELSQRFPFRYALHFPNSGPISDAALESAVRLSQRLNATAVIIHQPMFDQYSSKLLQIDPNLPLAIENHGFNPAGFERWADVSPGLTLDVEHLWCFTLKDAPLSTLLDRVEQFLQRHASKLHHVHLPGYQPGGEEHHPIYENEELGTEILTRLNAHGFTNLVVSEAEVHFQTLEHLRKDVSFFENWKRTLPADQ